MSDKKQPRGPHKPKLSETTPSPEIVEVDLGEGVEIQTIDTDGDMPHFRRTSGVERSTQMREYRWVDGQVLLGIYKGPGLTPRRLVEHIFGGGEPPHPMPPHDSVIYEGDFCRAVVRIFGTPARHCEALFIEPLTAGEWAAFREATDRPEVNRSETRRAKEAAKFFGKGRERPE